ncbi:MAG: DUF3489 domain-containing protein [Alphaproteobacteria bacterium]
MAKQLTDTQLIILSNASQREDGMILPLPESLRLPGGAIKKSLTALLTRGLIEEVGAPIDDIETQPTEYRITTAGLAAIGIQDETEESASSGAAKKSDPSASARKPTAKTGAKQSGKPELLLRLMRRKQGATITAMQDATGWQPHSVRAVLSGLRKNGHDIERTRNNDGKPVYRIEAGDRQ